MFADKFGHRVKSHVTVQTGDLLSQVNGILHVANLATCVNLNTADEIM